MREAVAMRGANAATALVLGLLLASGAIVVSDIGTYLLPAGGGTAPIAQGEPPGTAGEAPALDVRRQPITVPLSIRPRREAVRHGGGATVAHVERRTAWRPAPKVTPEPRRAIWRPRPRPERDIGPRQDRPPRNEHGRRTASVRRDAGPPAHGNPPAARMVRPAVSRMLPVRDV